jgi:hypothetical protein
MTEKTAVAAAAASAHSPRASPPSPPYIISKSAYITDQPIGGRRERACGLRVGEEGRRVGLDVGEHGGAQLGRGVKLSGERYSKK